MFKYSWKKIIFWWIIYGHFRIFEKVLWAISITIQFIELWKKQFAIRII